MAAALALLGPEGREQLKQAGRVGSVGLELVIAMAIGFLAGRWLDEQLGTAPYLKAIGFFLGVAAGFKGLYNLHKRTDLDKL
jgi:ATP synthase protein I